MDTPRIYEEDGYIHFMLRPEDLMRLRYSEEANTPFADFMEQWLGQMKTQVRENTLDGYRYAFEKHIRPFFTARALFSRVLPLSFLPLLLPASVPSAFSPSFPADSTVPEVSAADIAGSSAAPACGSSSFMSAFTSSAFFIF